MKDERYFIMCSTLTSPRKYHKKPVALRAPNRFLLLFSTSNDDRQLPLRLELTNMVLPRGMRFHPRATELIAIDSRAVIEIETGNNNSHNVGYRLKLRTFDEAIVPYFNDDWTDFVGRFGLQPGGLMTVEGQPQSVAYVGAEHAGDPKLPNITIVPNFLTNGPANSSQTWTVFGATMGHHHLGESSTPKVQEVYEFQSYGIMVICRPAQPIEMWVARAGDKVSVPRDCQMTLYNLGDRNNPLITLDFANPNRNSAHKDVIKQSGPVLLAYYNDFEVIFLLNKGCISDRGNFASADVVGALSPEDRQIRISRGGRSVLGQLLYERLVSDPEVIGQFARLGVVIKRATCQAVLEYPENGQGSRLYFSLPLVSATKPGCEVYRYFFPESERVEPIQGQNSIAEIAKQMVREKANVIRNSRMNRSDPHQFEIMIEGIGDWVEKTYRPLMIKTVRKLNERLARGESVKRLRVIYANDSRWKDAPDWINNLHPWETYVDKADADDLDAYRFAAPDVVFVATPDSTHSEIARVWLTRTPLIFIEKPFDSDLNNVHELMRAVGAGPSPGERLQYAETKVLGLDHYQFYALSISHLSTAIEKHLDGALAEIKFFLAENQAIEYRRDRTLQHGLTLDLLPHLLALLSYFGDIRTIDEIQILEAGQYVPLDAISKDGANREDISESFHNETWSRLRFTFQDYSGNGHRVPCTAVVGKGFARPVKFLEVKGRNGNSIRLDLSGEVLSEIPGYPADSLFFMASEQASNLGSLKVEEVEDPYDENTVLRVLSDPQEPHRLRGDVFRDRYADLINDLLDNTGTAAASTLFMKEGESIVNVLDRIWWAIQDAKPFIKGNLHEVRAI